MSRVVLAACLAVAVACGGSSSPSGPSPSPSSSTPACCWSASGTGDSVFSMPTHVQTVRVTGTYTASSANFIIWVGAPGSACGALVGLSCRLLVNELLGTLWGPTTYTGTVQTGGGGTVTVEKSSGVAWTMTEVR